MKMCKFYLSGVNDVTLSINDSQPFFICQPILVTEKFGGNHPLLQFSSLKKRSYVVSDTPKVFQDTQGCYGTSVENHCSKGKLDFETIKPNFKPRQRDCHNNCKKCIDFSLLLEPD